METPASGRYPQPKGNKLFSRINYNTHYSITSYILLFFSFSFLGWLWEIAIHLFENGEIVNKGFLTGPWLPIYGTGGVMMLLFLRKFMKNRVLTFFLIMIMCSALEYATGWYLDVVHGQRWWDYSGYFFNLNGYVSLLGAVFFGLGGCGFIYILAPLLNELFEKIPHNICIGICVVLVILFSVDFTYSQVNPNMGKGITDYTRISIGVDSRYSQFY